MSKQPMNSRPAGYTPQAPMSNGGTAVAPRSGPGAPMANGASAESKPTVESIRKRAYELYLARAAKGQPGNAATDWTQAERDLLGKR